MEDTVLDKIGSIEKINRQNNDSFFVKRKIDNTIDKNIAKFKAEFLDKTSSSSLKSSDSVNKDVKVEEEKVIDRKDNLQSKLEIGLPEDISKSPIKVGLLLPLTGSGSKTGNAMLNAAMMAVFDVADSRLQLVPRDTKGLTESAAVAAESIIADGVELILGPLFRESVVAVAGVARPADINIIAFSNDRYVAGGGVYLLGFMPDQQVQRVFEYANSQGFNKFAALLPDNAYGDEILFSIDSFVPKIDAEIIQIEKYNSEAEDFRDYVKKISQYDRRREALLENKLMLAQQNDVVAQKALDRLKNQETLGSVSFNAILLPEGGEKLRSIAPLLAFYDVDPTEVKLLGTGLWDEANLGFEPALIGGWFAGPTPSVGKKFRERYKRVFGVFPPRLASLAYDATALAAVLARDKFSPYFNNSQLTNISGFTGIDGLFRFREDGIAERGLAVLEVRRDGFFVVSPAPVMFE